MVKPPRPSFAQIDWRKVAGLSAGLAAIPPLLVAWAVRAEQRAYDEEHRYRWSDKNRWPHGE